MKYLYGAAVQGIQEFIFQTNKLREIIGASELVEEICTSKFAYLLGKEGGYSDLKKDLENDDNAIVHAAGNIKYIFDDKAACENIVKRFPKAISEFAPGITVSQSVVKFNDNEEFPEAVKRLEANLRTQRNKPMRYPMLGLMGIERGQQTGLPVCVVKGNKHLDAATFAKLYNQQNTTKKLSIKAFGNDKINDCEIPYDISDITGKNDWIAIIHADGNGLGQIVQKIGTNPTEFKKFSKKLDEATTAAAVGAYNKIYGDILSKEAISVIPIRPIVLGGDDLTVICRADLAIEYVKVFIKEFEEQTRIKLGDILRGKSVFEHKDYLTACAGIVYIKSSFPFYYGYELAESLCSRAKTDAKNALKEGELPASCIMFHKVQDSFVEDYKDVSERELKPQKDISFEFGPYYLKQKANRWTIDDLIDKVKKLVSADKSGLRNWMSLLHTNPSQAEQYLERLKDISGNKSFLNDVTDKKNMRDNNIVYPVYDILAIHTIYNQETR